MKPADRRVIACNIATPTKTAVAGAKAYVVLLNPGNGHDRLLVLIRSRGGRWIEKWEPLGRLTNFRAVTIPPEHPMYGRERLWDVDADELAAELARGQTAAAQSTCGARATFWPEAEGCEAVCALSAGHEPDDVHEDTILGRWSEDELPTYRASEAA